jgi:hypothetical protein
MASYEDDYSDDCESIDDSRLRGGLRSEENRRGYIIDVKKVVEEETLQKSSQTDNYQQHLNPDNPSQNA